MTTYFPPFYPDETMYSILARFSIYNGNLSYKHTIQDLFGVTTKRSVPDLPSNIEILIKRFPQIDMNPEEIIFKHTLFPYFAAFIPEDRVKKIIQKMINGDGSTIHTQIGINASSIIIDRTLKHCGECIREDFNLFRETYWHRIHQLPGVFVCPKHQIPLVKIRKKLYDFNQHQFLPASEELFDFSATITYSKQTYEVLLAFAKEAEWIINNSITMPNYSFYKDKYIALLQNANIVSSNGRVDQILWFKKVTQFYNFDLLNLLESEVNNHPTNWIRTIVQKHRKIFHPIRHILIIMLLCGNARSFFSDTTKYSPFGEGPWPCLNPAHHFFRKKGITNLKISTCKDTKKPVGTFSCECGFIYSRRGPDLAPNDQFKRGRIVEFGNVWKTELKKLIGLGLPLREIARRLDVDPQTIKRQAILMELPFSWEGEQLDEAIRNARFNINKDNKKLEEVINVKRKSWLAIMSQNPGVGVKALRNSNNSLYYWLYRNDKEWLSENSPKKLIERVQVKKVDWEERDKKLRNEVKQILRNWNDYEKGRPIKITKTAIAKKTENPHWIHKTQEKIPRTFDLISSHIETEDQYNIRKLNWALNKLLSNGEVIREWALYRAAAIRTEKITSEVKAYTESLLI
jgi:hypothetical protein